MSDTVRFGIVGGGLMGREAASAMGRWLALTDMPVKAELTAVCDLVPATREWFRRVPSVSLITESVDELLASDAVDAVYVAVPHHLHEDIYTRVLAAGKDMLAEKPFGIDLGAAKRIESAARASGRFVRCSSEFPFFPGAQRAFALASSGAFGAPLQVVSCFWHSSDLDPRKPINWKRQAKFNGEIGVMGDLGLHVAHLPLRLGFRPSRVYAQLQNVFTTRPGPDGSPAACDTWDNAILHCWTEIGGVETPMRWETKRIAPGETDTWSFELLGTEGGVRFSTKHPKTLEVFEMGKEQAWKRIDLGHASAFPVVTGGIFEFGFPDLFLQMLAAFVAERGGLLNGRFGCATVEEAVDSHRVFDAALRSHLTQTVAEVEGR